MKRLSLFAITFLLITFQSFAQQNNFWTEHGVGILNVGKAATRSNFPSNFKLFDADLGAMQAYIASSLTANPKQIILSLPNAYGMMEEFELTEASNFEPDLQNKFSQIRSFSGKGITDKNAFLKLSISPEGIQTMLIRDGKEEEYIEPYSDDKLTYAVFKSQRASGQLPWNCYTQDQKITSALSQILNDQPISIARSGGNLKILRLALSCNAEYANYFGATSNTPENEAKVIAAFNATLTRCNGIFEKDLAIHLNLIPRTTSVIYYNPATDPYSINLESWNSQLQAALTSVIGDANYDIGHMFGSTGGGGNAGCIGCICDIGKGSGITSPADGIPQGDNFDIDYVAHEIGHQLGANHTLSSFTEGTGVNKEVGSGITIMGYAGITSQDVAPHSIDIFHQASIAQIEANIGTKTCGTTLVIGANNTAPVIAPLTNYTIPRSTPFALTGSATDINGDLLTYAWEQNDNALSTQFVNNTGTQSVASETKTSGPNWISFRPTTSPTRLFPQLSTILAGATVTGPLPGGDPGANIEALSSVARTLNFRLTVRDNAPYSSALPEVGQTSFADMVVTVANVGPFTVTSPNTNVSWGGGTTQTVTWSVNSTNLAPIYCANVKISLSTDGGQTFPIVLAESTPNDGSQAVVIPSNLSTTARIKIEAIGNIFFDISNANFNITTPPLCGSPTGLTTTSITANTANISWTAVPNATSYSVEYKLNSATTWTVFNPSQTTTTASLTGLTANTAYNWQVRATCAAGVGNYVIANFTTTAACGNPTGLTTASITANTANINWTAVPNAISYAIEYKLNTALNWTVLNATQTTTTASLTGLTPSTAYNWRVRANCPAGAGTYVSANFTTTAACSNPTGLTTSSITMTNANLAWTAVANATNYTVEYKLNSATTWTVLSAAQTTTTASLTGLTAGTLYNWRVRANCTNGSATSTQVNFTTLSSGVITTCQNALDTEINGTSAGASVIPFNTNVTGLINIANDLDCYRFALTRGGRITITLTTLPANYNVRLRNAAGAQVAIAQRTGTSNETINYTAAVGTYYVEVYGANAAANNTTRCYTLRVNPGTAGRGNNNIYTINNGISVETGQSTEGSEVAQEVELFPNPISNELQVKLIAIGGQTVIEVFDLTGKKVATKTANTNAGTVNNTSVDMSRNAKGIYLVRVTNNNKVIHQRKIIKQ